MIKTQLEQEKGNMSEYHKKKYKLNELYKKILIEKFLSRQNNK
jgi:hypothetical protein